MNEFIKFYDDVQYYSDYLEGLCFEGNYEKLFSDERYNCVISQFGALTNSVAIISIESLYKLWLCYGRRLLDEGHKAVYDHLSLALICRLIEENEIRNLAYILAETMNQLLEKESLSGLYECLYIIDELLCGVDFIWTTDQKIEILSNLGSGDLAFELKKSFLTYYKRYCHYNLSHVAHAVQCEFQKGCVEHAFFLLKHYEEEFCYYVRSYKDYQLRIDLLLNSRDATLYNQYYLTVTYCLARLNYSQFITTENPLNRLLMALHMTALENTGDERYQNKLRGFKAELIKDYLGL